MFICCFDCGRLVVIVQFRMVGWLGICVCFCFRFGEVLLVRCVAGVCFGCVLLGDLLLIRWC